VAGVVAAANDPGWSAQFRARIRASNDKATGGPGDDLTPPSTPLTPIVVWRFPFAYLLPPTSLLLWLIVAVFSAVMVRSGSAGAIVWAIPAITTMICVLCPWIAAAAWPWPRPEEGPDVLLARYVARLKLAVGVSLFVLFGNVVGAIFAIDADKPAIALLDVILWGLGTIWIAPTRARIRRDVEKARGRGLDLAVVLFGEDAGAVDRPRQET
jgi:hypothetical protein